MLVLDEEFSAKPPAAQAVPDEFHFVFGLRPQPEAFHLVHWLCLESCRVVNQPRRIHLHCRHLPHGPWWDRIEPHLDIHRVDALPRGFAPERYAESDEGRLVARTGIDYAHEADFLRLEILHARGGVYADMDTLFVEPYPSRWFDLDCALGEEMPPLVTRGWIVPSLCNAVIIARPQSAFIAHWIEEARRLFDGRWSSHSCQAATRLWYADPGMVTVLPKRAFYHHSATPGGIASLLTRNDARVRGVKSLHLWAHLWWTESRDDMTGFHAGLITPEWVRDADATYAVLARRFLPSDA